MPSITYNLNIPFQTNNPSVDQPNMLINTNATNTIWGVNHFAFADPNAGKHKIVELPVQSPFTGVAGEATLYSQTLNGFANLVYTNGSSGNQYQLTRAVPSNFTQFGTNGPLVAGDGGWTFLPGGIIMQYGSVSWNGGQQAVTFPITYTTLYNIQASFAPSLFNSLTSILPGSPSLSGFKGQVSPGVTVTMYWTALGV